MSNGIPVFILLAIFKEITRLETVTSSQIREIARQLIPESMDRIELDTTVEKLEEDGWIEGIKIPPLFESGIPSTKLCFEDVDNLWQLTDVAKGFSAIKINAGEKATKNGINVLSNLLQERAQRKLRKGQTKFRQKLLKLYDSRCMISGCIAEQSLEAAHIEPYAYAKCNSVENGLLLRADIHTLFDKLLISVKPTTLTVVVSKKLAHSEYAAFQGVNVRPHPSLDLDALRANLMAHFDGFGVAETF